MFFKPNWTHQPWSVVNSDWPDDTLLPTNNKQVSAGGAGRVAFGNLPDSPALDSAGIRFILNQPIKFDQAGEMAEWLKAAVC